MPRVVLTAAAVVAVWALAGSAVGAYWYNWTGDDGNWPEAVGYTRSWGNWQGQHQGGANRTLENGILTYDSLYDPGVYDFYYMVRLGQMDPGPGEQLVMEWALKVDSVVGAYDPSVGFFSDERWAVGFEYAEDHIRSAYENAPPIPIAPHEWHEYSLRSVDLRSYDLYVDGTIARHGALIQLVAPSYVGFGDGVQGAASLHHWDYFRFGAVPIPEPSGTLLALVAIAWRGVTHR